MIVLLLNQKCGVGRTARVAFCRCAAMPKPTLTVIDADRKALRGTGPSSARCFADPDTWTLYARNNAANKQLEAHLSAARPNDQHTAGSARPHQGRPARHGIATAGAPHDLAQARSKL